MLSVNSEQQYLQTIRVSLVVLRIAFDGLNGRLSPAKSSNNKMLFGKDLVGTVCATLEELRL